MSRTPDTIAEDIQVTEAQIGLMETQIGKLNRQSLPVPPSLTQALAELEHKHQILLREQFPQSPDID